MKNSCFSSPVVILFKPAGSAPALKQPKFKLSTEATIKTLLDFLRQQLQIPASDPLVTKTFQRNKNKTSQMTVLLL